MQFFTRVLIVLAVLGGLGYGSYAFGKYVLSARLFGPQKGAQTTTTASVGSDPLQAPSNADVEIVPAPQPVKDSDDNNTSPAAINPTATPDDRVEVIPSQNSDSGSTRDSSDNRPEPTRKPRRRRRRARPTPRPASRPPVAPRAEAPPARAENVDPPTRDNSNNDTPGVETPRSNDPVPVPTRRRRERRTDVAPAPRVETPRAETPREVAPRIREREPRRDTSPVPVPEGARNGGDGSPVPIPG